MYVCMYMYMHLCAYIVCNISVAIGRRGGICTWKRQGHFISRWGVRRSNKHIGFDMESGCKLSFLSINIFFAFVVLLSIIFIFCHTLLIWFVCTLHHCTYFSRIPLGPVRHQSSMPLLIVVMLLVGGYKQFADLILFLRGTWPCAHFTLCHVKQLIMWSFHYHE